MSTHSTHSQALPLDAAHLHNQLPPAERHHGKSARAARASRKRLCVHKKAHWGGYSSLPGQSKLSHIGRRPRTGDAEEEGRARPVSNAASGLLDHVVRPLTKGAEPSISAARQLRKCTGMATPGDAPLTLLIDLASFVGRPLNEAGGDTGSGALRVCQQAVAHLVALWLAARPGASWVYHLVDSRLPPHAFTRVADFVKYSGAASPTHQDGQRRCMINCLATAQAWPACNTWRQHSER